MIKTITVSAKALEELLRAVMGPPHHVRELQFTRGLPGFNNCIDTLQREFNAAIAAPAVERQEPLLIQAVAVTREGDDGMYLEWLLEGGICELELPGTMLFAMPDANDLCDEDGSAEIYTSPPAPVSVVPETPEQEGQRLAKADPNLGSNLRGATLRTGEEFNRLADSYNAKVKELNQ